MIDILLADDQELVRTALVALLELEDDFHVVATVGRGDEVVSAVERTQPMVVLLDIEMPGLDGISAAIEVHRHYPNCRIIMLTTFGRPGYLRRAMESGASGFVVKDAPAATLAATIRSVAEGRTVVDPVLAGEALSIGQSPLSPRESEVLGAFRHGAPVAEVAAHLHLSEGTVRNYLSSAITKTGTKNRASALLRAEELGWLSSP
ncbi:response regulator transcription factor [Ferrimicrobium sp.]|uniref:response regulator transcription factor n=1 Tax=Ferrimicrobium sp. TaxID=2926050 RepID=UPI002619BF4F|nr:response regulator transcription factor [Ferrimicrobium sp.]